MWKGTGTDGKWVYVLEMAKYVVETFTDDIDGTDGAETVTFAFDGTSYEIDLSERNKARLAKALDPFIGVARRSGRRERPAARKAAGRKTAGRTATIWSSLSAEEKDRMRAWGTRRKLTTKTARRIADSAVQAWIDAGKP